MNQTSQQPILFFSFADSAEHPLHYLEEEYEMIYRNLAPAINKQIIQIHRTANTTLDEIAHYITLFKNRIELFHYGGHADSEELFLKDQNANANGIAYLLAAQQSLKLVFLNGCSTFEQVKLLQELGIPAIIATNVPVSDRSASHFAQSFYNAVMADYTIGEAFEIAAAVMLAKNGNKPKVYRTIKTRTPTENKIPWGIYVKNEAILGERLIPSAPKHSSKNEKILKDTEIKTKGNIRIGNNIKGLKPNQKTPDSSIRIEGSKIETDKDFTMGDTIDYTE